MRCDMKDSSVSESVGLEGLGIRLTHTCDGQSGLPQFTVLVSQRQHEQSQSHLRTQGLPYHKPCSRGELNKVLASVASRRAASGVKKKKETRHPVTA
jgi:hypothetical protein